MSTHHLCFRLLFAHIFPAICLFLTSAHSDPGTPQSGQRTPHSDGEASGRENQSDDEKWGGGAKSDQSEDEEEKRHYSDEERENSDDEGPRNRKPGTNRAAIKIFKPFCA